jgi:hypothetical protein
VGLSCGCTICNALRRHRPGLWRLCAARRLTDGSSSQRHAHLGLPRSERLHLARLALGCLGRSAPRHWTASASQVHADRFRTRSGLCLAGSRSTRNGRSCLMGERLLSARLGADRDSTVRLAALLSAAAAPAPAPAAPAVAAERAAATCASSATSLATGRATVPALRVRQLVAGAAAAAAAAVLLQTCP